MRVTQTFRPIAGESALAVVPRPAQRVDATAHWSRRALYATGRVLTPATLVQEQSTRALRAAALSRALAPGVVHGFETAVFDNDPSRIAIGAGLALTRGGEDVTLLRPVQVATGSLLVAAESLRDADPAWTTDERAALDADDAWTLPALRERFARTRVPLAAVLLARPVTLPRDLGPARAPCVNDPAETQQDLFFEDGTRFEWYLWPAARWPLPPPGPAWRNRLAWCAFDRERAGDSAPWLDAGAPLALAGIDAEGLPLFLDRQAVVREGGGRRARRVLLGGRGDEPLWQAQLLQFAEHLSELPPALLVAEATALVRPELAAQFDRLPPCGLLPRSVADLERAAQGFFPLTWQIEARVVSEEIVQTMLAESASLAPLAFGADASIELLVPVPAAAFDADLLRLDVPVNPLFALEISRLEATRRSAAQERDGWLRRGDAVAHAASGVWPERPDVDAAALADEQGAAKAEFFRRTHRGGPATGSGLEAHGFAGVSETFVLRAGDRLLVYVELPAGAVVPWLLLQPLMRVQPDPAAPTLAMLPGPVFWWGVDSTAPSVSGVAAGALREAGRLPARIADDADAAQRWQRLEIDASHLGVDAAHPTITLEGLCYGVVAASAGQFVNWGHAGAVAAGQERIWVGDLLPAGALIESSGPLAAADAAAEGPWPWRGDAPELPAIEGLSDDGTRRVFAEVDNLYIDAASNRAIVDLQAPLRDSAGAISQIPTALDRGLARSIEVLDAKARAANDQVEFGFLRSRVDLYRLRSRLLGQEEANRLLTSPAIAQLVQRSETSFATEKQLTEFLASPKALSPAPAGPSPAPPRPAAAAPQSAAPEAAAPERARPLRASALRFGVATGLVSAPAPASVPIESRVVGAPLTFEPRDSAAVLAGSTFIAEARPPSLLIDAGASRPIAVATPAPPSEAVVAGASSFNISSNTTTLGERLKEAPAVDAWSAAVGGKASSVGGSVQALADLKLPIGGLKVYGFRSGAGALTDVAGLLAAGADARAAEADDTGFKSEADYFKVSVDAIDNGIRFFRGVESLVEEYRALRLLAEATQARLAAMRQRCVDAIAALDRRLAEVRHDLGVARALLGEEVARIDAIVARRRGVLRERVRFLAYRRARLADRLDDVPVRSVEARVGASPVPACQAGSHEIAPDIVRMTQAMRDLPARHFIRFAQTLDAIVDRSELLDMVRSTAARAPVALDVDEDDGPATSKPALAIKTLQRSMAERALAHAEQRRAIDSRAATQAAHSELLRVARERLVVSDLLLGRRTLAASGELDDIARVAACLMRAVQQVPPAVRLVWATSLSEFDRAPSLRNLANLPQFGDGALGLDFGDWRAMQQMVDWLFSRIDAGSLEAESMMNDLVRIALLLASHAPVKNLIPARLAMPVRPLPGLRIELAVGALAAVRVGMSVTLASAAGAPQASAIVRDTAPGRVSAEVLESLPEPALLGVDAVVHLHALGR